MVHLCTVTLATSATNRRRDDVACVTVQRSVSGTSTHRDGLAVSHDKELGSVIHWAGTLQAQAGHRSYVDHCTTLTALILPHVLQG